MASKRARGAALEMPHPLITLRDHDCLNGRAILSRTGNAEYYKSQGLSDEACARCVNYLIHTGPAERTMLFEKLISGGTTPFLMQKLTMEYQLGLKDILARNAGKIRRSEPLEADAQGVLH